ncbi:MAG: phosphoribosylformylglycinamidine synthase subunit PurS [Actinomycetota bacterium]|nr:phosphoribosylformylglycinamidine synthase subunit PurS [Actinomycetota bacterium]
MTYSFVVSIARKPGLSDPEGTTTHKALNDLGFAGVTHVAFGRTISVSLDAVSLDAARTQVEAMCEKLLANPVMETYAIEATP